MASKTNVVINGVPYYKITRKVGMKKSKSGEWIGNYKAFYGKSKKEAEAKFQEYMHNQNRAGNSSQPVGALIDEWIEAVFKVSDSADGTKSRYISCYNNYFKDYAIAGTICSEIRPLDLQTHYNKLNCPPSSIKALNKLLRRFFKYAAVNGLCDDITASVEVPRTDSKSKYDPDKESIEVWSDEELRELLTRMEAQEHRLYFLVVLAVNTGARISELLALKYSNLEGGVMQINKQVSNVSVNDIKSPHLTKEKTSSSRRVIPLNTAVIDALKKHRAWHKKEMKDCGYVTDNVFTTKSGKYYDRHNIATALYRFYDSNGIPRHKFHAFRHTFGTNLSKAGVPIEETSALMGHSSIDVTAKYYINISAERKRSAVELLPKYN